jgi:ribosomal protein S18 acetylase RimI-like enzyme
MGADPLDNPVWSSLTGPHAGLAEIYGQARRYPDDLALFGALPDNPGRRAWNDLAELAGAGTRIGLIGEALEVPSGFEVGFRGAGVQLVATGALAAEGSTEPMVLTDADQPEILELVERTAPGPFRPHTNRLGSYLGLRRHGRLVAMAGERLRPAGWTEISAVCTDPAWRGQGLGTLLVRAVAAGILERGERPLMHTAAENLVAIRLYESLGFRVRRTVSIIGVRARA